MSDGSYNILPNNGFPANSFSPLTYVWSKKYHEDIQNSNIYIPCKYVLYDVYQIY